MKTWNALLLLVLFSSSLSFAGHTQASGAPNVRPAAPAIDCSNPPKEFKDAEYPYAKKPDGCSGLTNPKQVRDGWMGADFVPACNRHDRCYYTVGSSHLKCNWQFRRDLEAACKKGMGIKNPFRKKKKKSPWHRIIMMIDPIIPEFMERAPRYAACMVIAHSYVTAVETAVRVVFKDAQDMSRRYEKWNRACRKDKN